MYTHLETVLTGGCSHLVIVVLSVWLYSQGNYAYVLTLYTLLVMVLPWCMYSLGESTPLVIVKLVSYTHLVTLLAFFCNYCIHTFFMSSLCDSTHCVIVLRWLLFPLADWIPLVSVFSIGDCTHLWLYSLGDCIHLVTVLPWWLYSLGDWTPLVMVLTWWLYSLGDWTPLVMVLTWWLYSWILTSLIVLPWWLCSLGDCTHLVIELPW